MFKFIWFATMFVLGRSVLFNFFPQLTEILPEDKFEVEKYRIENDFDNTPDRVAGWAGQEVGNVEGEY